MKRLFVAAVCLQLLILALIPYRKLRARFLGRDMVLVADQYDPYHPFEGYHVRISYEIGSIPVEGAIPAPSHRSDRRGKRVYTILETDSDGVTHPRGIAMSRDEIPAERTFISGIQRGGAIEYGIERFFVPEDRHVAIDAELARARLESIPIRARVRVDELGNCVLIGITIGQNEYDY